MSADLELAVHQAVASVHDPEYPGVSIVDLGLVEELSVEADGTVSVGLIPTFSGCPALAMIADDVRSAVTAVHGITTAHVRWLSAPVWSVDRITTDARSALAEQFTVSVKLGSEPAPCPRCGSPTSEQSMFGPSRCRAVHRCQACGETVEVMRS